MKTNFFDLDPDGLEAFAAEHGCRSFLGTQLLKWVFERGVTAPQAMTDLSKFDRSLLDEFMSFGEGETCAAEEASDGTRKILLRWPAPHNAANDESPLQVLQTRSGGETECVMIPTEKRRTACVSSQIGCPVGCRFCASGLGGLEGNLSSGRIVEQAWRLSQLPSGPITNVVFMGMGEPLANFSNVTRAVRAINAPWGLGIGARRITISTVGLPTAIRRLGDFEIPVTLALSLHAPNDTLRKEIIPWAEYATIDEILDACDEYFHKSGREITLEYILLGGFNDSVEHARELAEVASSLRANVNLIRYNEVEGLPFRRPRTEDVLRFQDTLRRGRVNAHIRASRGRDISAACGQLRHRQRTEDGASLD